MASASDILTLVSSLALRLSIWIFLRWVSAQQH
jgi:alkaline phosphatase D